MLSAEADAGPVPGPVAPGAPFPAASVTAASVTAASVTAASPTAASPTADLPHAGLPGRLVAVAALASLRVPVLGTGAPSTGTRQDWGTRHRRGARRGDPEAGQLTT